MLRPAAFDTPHRGARRQSPEIRVRRRYFLSSASSRAPVYNERALGFAIAVAARTETRDPEPSTTAVKCGQAERASELARKWLEFLRRRSVESSIPSPDKSTEK